VEEDGACLDVFACVCVCVCLTEGNVYRNDESLVAVEVKLVSFCFFAMRVNGDTVVSVGCLCVCVCVCVGCVCESRDVRGCCIIVEVVGAACVCVDVRAPVDDDISLIFRFVPRAACVCACVRDDNV